MTDLGPTKGRILVTGASGFIGRQCLPHLSAAGFEVHALTHRGLNLPSGPWTWHQWDLLADADLGSLLADVRPTHVLHLAWLTTPGQFWYSPVNQSWIEASMRLFEAAVAGGTRRIVVAGTVAEYDWSVPEPFGPQTPLHPDKPYGIAKDALRRRLAALASDGGVDMAWARLYYLYGPHEHPQRLVPQVIRALLAGQPIETTDGRQRRDFLHVSDVATALVALTVAKVTGAVDVGSSDPISVRHIITAIGDLIGRPDLLRLGACPRVAGDPDLLVSGPSLLRSAGLWQPTIGLRDGLAATIAWWRQQP